MDRIVANAVSAIDATKLIERGRELKCPICSATIKTVPEKWTVGIPLHGLECPADQKHFVIHYDDASLVREMRARMKEIAKEK
jgi:hypothetical protein